MKSIIQRHGWLAATAGLTAAALVACGGGGGGSGSATGTLRMAMTDAPSCGYDNVWVTVTNVRVHTSSTAAENDPGWQELPLGGARRIDLLGLTNGALEELGQTPLPTGTYTQVRLVLADNADTPAGADPLNAVLPTGGSITALDTPSGQTSGVKLNANFTVQPNQLADLVLDFDACRSVVPRGGSGQYNLKPVVAVIPRLVSGVLGFVSPALATTPGTVVSAQQGGAVIRSTVPAADGSFVIPYLGVGNYTIVVQGNAVPASVVTGVPVTAGTVTALNDINTPITPVGTATMKDVTGTVTQSGSGTLVTTARVRALQTLAGGAAIELANVPVNATTAVYTTGLAASAPQVAAFVTAPVAGFVPDATAGTSVTMQAVADGFTPGTGTVDLGTATSPATVNLTVTP